jgi:hypothetical protein
MMPAQTDVLQPCHSTITWPWPSKHPLCNYDSWWLTRVVSVHSFVAGSVSISTRIRKREPLQINQQLFNNVDSSYRRPSWRRRFGCFPRPGSLPVSRHSRQSEIRRWHRRWLGFRQLRFSCRSRRQSAGQNCQGSLRAFVYSAEGTQVSQRPHTGRCYSILGWQSFDWVIRIE